MKRYKRFAGLATLLLLAGNVLAADSPPDEGATETPEWREAWKERGLTLEGAFKLDHFHATRGGSSRGGATMTHLDLKARFDLDKLWNWSDAIAYINVINDRGEGINARHLASLMGASNIEVGVPTTRVFHAWVQQTFMEEQWALLAGLYPIDSEFSVLDSAGPLLHPSYGASADLSLTRGPSIFNNSAFGIRLKWQAADRTHYVMGAVLDGMPGDPRNPQGTHIQFNQGDGAFAIAEIGWTPIERGHVFEPVGPPSALQTPELKLHEKYEGYSKYAAGVWRYTSKVDDQFATDTAGDPLKRRSWGGYLLAERTLFRLGDEPGRHLTAFARHAFTDGDSTPIRAQTNLGVSLRGPIATRTDDILTLAWTGARLASKYRAAQLRDTGRAAADREEVVELNYRALLNPSFAIQPDLQWVRHPGGDRAARDATLIGIRFELLL